MAEHTYFARCNTVHIVVKVDLPADLSADATPNPPKVHHGIWNIWDCYLAAILDSSRKGGNFTLLLLT